MAAKGSGGTVYLIGLILAIVVALVLLGIAYFMNTELTKTTAEVKSLEDKLKKEEQANREKANEINEARKLIAGSTSTPINYELYQTTILQEANKTLQEVIRGEWVSSEDWKNIKDDQVRKIWENLVKYDGKFDRFQSLCGQDGGNLALYPELINQLRAVIHVIPRLRLDADNAKAQFEQLKKETDEVRSSKQKEIDGLRNQLLQEQDKNLTLLRTKEEEKKKLLDEKDRIQKEMAATAKQFKLDLAYEQSKKKELEARIRELTAKKARTYYENAKADGEVVFADSRLGYAWIDLGKQHGLKKGTRFDVYQYIKGGRQKIKGWIEVKRVDQDMAQVAIIEGSYRDPQTGEKLALPDPTDPIVKGDLIRNPFFEKDKQVRVAFLGTKLTNRYYNLKELERKIEEFGGKVQKEVSVETDILIVLARAEEEFQKEYEKAIQLGIDMMREDELLDYIGR
jgi:hypothetical protein